MTNNEILIKKIIYRSSHRGTREMDLLLGNFVKKHINSLREKELKDLEQILLLEDEIIYKWYFENIPNSKIPICSIANTLKNFKI